MRAAAPAGRLAGIGQRRPRRCQALALVTAIALGSLIVTGRGDESPATLTPPTPAPATTPSVTAEAAASPAAAALDAYMPLSPMPKLSDQAALAL